MAEENQAGPITEAQPPKADPTAKPVAAGVTQIGSTMGITENSAKVIYFRAKNMLKERLK